MNTLLENPLPILAVGGILATLCGLVFLSRRNLPSLFVFAVVVLLTLLLVVTERLIVTEREAVEQTLDTLLTAVESNDVPGVLALIDQEATEVLSDAEKLMPLVDVEDTGATAVEVEVDKGASPLTAISRFQGRLVGVHRKSGFKVPYFGRVELNWVRRDDRWLLQDFVAFKDGKPIDAVNSLKGRRPVP